MHGLAGKTALVTGGSKGVGLAIAQALARNGVNIALLIRADSAAAETAVASLRELGVKAGYWLADMTVRAEVVSVLEAMRDALGNIQLLVNNAGSTAPAPLLSLTDRQWQQVVSANLTGTFVVSTEVVRRMAGGGVVINIAGASAHRCYPGAGAYGPSKAAVVNLTQQMALEWAPSGIRVCGVSPGPIRPAGTGWQQHEPELAEEVSRLPLKRAGTPEEIAQTVCFLASDAASYITGQMLLVDGGGASTWYMTQTASGGTP
ncbi:SDR family NAD(P)-dependent oxidoreductase [Erwinia billingiae]|jgi:3-oxoacyl-[acyl-carrier protein] reductase|uniref:Short-chain dehydrogenase/reductase SDR n=1 Tax=Erwinia billingiae (strain Eb661) TaxID=634500 RepID=D8MQZ6_ERWBE|nr:SDR family NAD(P)-dependent oxidoreductase [Erwinia billingiae]CAX59253.1 Short-chain dehydrogenase/reductase SDR [Erwinia billingiae Eb661]